MKSKILEAIDLYCEENQIDLLLLGDGDSRELYAPAIVGITDGHWTTDKYDDRIAVVYDENKVIEIVMDQMEPEQDDDAYSMAREHFDFNIKGSWLGPHTPIFISGVQSILDYFEP